MGFGAAALLNAVAFELVNEVVQVGGVSAAMVAATFSSNRPESLAAGVGLVTCGMSRGRLRGMWVGIALMSGTAAAFGYGLLHNASPNLTAFFQTFAAGAMLTMLADTMVPNASEEGGKPVGLLPVLGVTLAVWLALFAQVGSRSPAKCVAARVVDAPAGSRGDGRIDGQTGAGQRHPPSSP